MKHIKQKNNYVKPIITQKKIPHNVWMMQVRPSSDEMLSGDLIACWIGTCSAFGDSGPCSWSC